MSTAYRQWITSEPSVMFGKPVVVGTRITVELILERMAAGETIDQILGAFPNVSREAVLAALAFAADSMKSEVVHATSVAK
ncbi:MAG: DUF433 domain-containing protein [Planctomycetia bacterium]|nr:DUF433 domain-containing protein [Planctomycetia bacterium]